MSEERIALRYTQSPAEVELLEPLWGALHAHHAEINPSLGGGAAKREAEDAWRRRRQKYLTWLGDPETFFLIAEADRRPVGYAFVTTGSGYASWATGERVAQLETLSVLPELRGKGLGGSLLSAVWDRLDQLGIEDMAITSATTNVDARRFYERHGFAADFVVYYGRRAGNIGPSDRPS